MANIQEDINQIATARYGREVRGSIVNALTLMNEESSEAIDKAVTAQDSATASAAEAKGYADRLVDLGGGTTGQVLTKKSNEDFDYSWEESQGGTSDAYETTYGESNVGDTLDIMPRLAGAVQGASPTPKDADTLGGKYRAEDIDLIKENLEGLGDCDVLLDGVFATNDEYEINTSDYKEIMIDGFQDYHYTVRIPTAILSNNIENYWLSGFYQNSQSNVCVAFGISKTKVKLSFASASGTTLNAFTAKVYGIK